MSAVMMRGAARRLRREHNERAWLAWHTAYLGAYAPRKGKDFPGIERLQLRPREPNRRRRDWRDDFAAMSAWASSAFRARACAPRNTR